MKCGRGSGNEVIAQTVRAAPERDIARTNESAAGKSATGYLSRTSAASRPGPSPFRPPCDPFGTPAGPPAGPAPARAGPPRSAVRTPDFA
ncbi:hypothetical protein GCM10009757_13750 [Streptomyces cheonanensis]|uniref:Uncharacterized protein n=1 Tax=Streptomyces cheonanensis TaxID=312720 RepID=A0ABP5GJ41_9ACTN